MQEKDITQKMLERHNDVFSDIVNVLLFGGKKVVAEESLFDSVTDSVLKIDKRVRIQDRDVAKYWKDSRSQTVMLSCKYVQISGDGKKRVIINFYMCLKKYILSLIKSNINYSIYVLQ